MTRPHPSSPRVSDPSETASDRPLPGLFLAFEGVEGAGKSTQVRLLAEHLRSRGREVVVAREPGSTPLGERIRETTLADADLVIPALSELFLMLAARAAFVEQVVRPALARGQVVIADRFELSTLAYQAAGRGLDLARVTECNRFATGGVTPHATVLLEVAPAVGAERHRAAGKAFDRLEQESDEFHARVARGYADLAGRIDGVLRVPADGPVGEVHRRVRAALAGRFPRNFP